MRALLATMVLLLASGCLATDAPAQEVATVDEPAMGPQPPAALPDAFTVEHRFPTQGIQVGGVEVRHEFTLAIPATLHLTFAAEVPEAIVVLEVHDADRGMVFSEPLPAPLDDVQRDIALEAGTYRASAQLYGYSTLKSFSLSGTFSADQ